MGGKALVNYCQGFSEMQSTSSVLQSPESSYTTTDFPMILKIIILNGLGLFLIDILFTYIVTGVFSQSATALGLVYALITLGNVISSPIVGVISDKYSKKRLVSIGAFGRGLSYITMYIGILTLNFRLYLIGTFLLGLLTGCFWIPLNSIISQKSHKHHRSYAFGRRDFALGMGQLIGGLVGYIIFSIGLKNFPTATYFIFICLPLYGVLNIVSAVIFLFRINEEYQFDNDHYDNAHYDKDRHDNGQEKITNPGESLPFSTSPNPPKINKLFLIGISLGTFAFMISSINGMLAKPFYQLYILNKFTSDPTLALVIYLPTGIFALVIAPYLGKFADKLNPFYGFFLISCSGALITWLLLSSPSIWVFMFLLIFDVAINSTANLLMEQIFSRISRKNRGKSFSTRNIAQNVGGIIGQISGGLLFDKIGITAPFLVSIAVELSLIPLFLIALKLILPYLEEK